MSVRDGLARTNLPMMKALGLASSSSPSSSESESSISSRVVLWDRGVPQSLGVVSLGNAEDEESGGMESRDGGGRGRVAEADSGRLTTKLGRRPGVSDTSERHRLNES